MILSGAVRSLVLVLAILEQHITKGVFDWSNLAAMDPGPCV